jgi:hypothetical protein
MRGWPNETSSAQCSVTTVSPRVISFTPFNGEWIVEVEQQRSKFRQVEDEIEEVILGAEMSPDVQSVARNRREIATLNPEVQFKYLL